jgi:hypothetical protein
MNRPARVLEVEHLGEYRLRITFSDGLARELDFIRVVGAGVFEPLTDPVLFAQVSVDEVAGTIVWPEGVELDPDVLHGDHEPVSGRAPTVLRQYGCCPNS